ncbi:single-stranded DNA-binding protein, partial [Francisella tularensis subsp. holarctica]|uniref:single-stranded DNA-binding protein n=1 Tax=Francisella tularensis TaxID=263 RepID=UPI002381AA27
FGNSAEAILWYANIGTQIIVEGRLRTNTWQDKNGNMQYTTEVVASNFQFIGGGSQGGANNLNTPNFNQQPNNNFNQ